MKTAFFSTLGVMLVGDGIILWLFPALLEYPLIIAGLMGTSLFFALQAAYDAWHSRLRAKMYKASENWSNNN